MNALVDYLFEHYHPGGNACRTASVDKILEKTPFSREELHRLAVDAYNEGYLLMDSIKIEEMEALSLTNKGLKRWTLCSPKDRPEEYQNKRMVRTPFSNDWR
jgi:hypothetical protein